MATATSRETLKDYCLRRLGFPVIDINVDDGQIEDRVDDALQFFSEYHFDGVERKYVKYQLTTTDITNGYVDSNAIDTNIISVTRCFDIDDMSIGSIGGGMWRNDSSGMGGAMADVTGYHITQRHISLLNSTFNPEKAVRFSRVMNKINIDMNWTEKVEAGKWLMFELYSVLDPNTYTEIYNNRLLKEYLTALIKRQWGQNLSKFEGLQMPGGVAFSGAAMLTEANEDIKRLEEEVQSKSELPPGFAVG